jgi:protease secretion system outer membrane protein
LGGVCGAGDASALTLMQAYEAALKNDPAYLSAVQDSIGGKEGKVQGRAGLLPQVSASYSANKTRADQTAPDLFTGGRNTTHPIYISHASVLQLRQPVFSLDALARYKQGLAQTDYSDAQFTSRVQEMMLRVTGAYIDALFSNEQVLLAKAQRDTYLEQKKVNDRLYQKGEGTKTDSIETQSRLDLSEAQVLEAIDNQANAIATLATLVGGEAANLDELRDDFRIAPLPEGGFDTLRKTALEANPEVQAQLFAIEASKQELNKARAGHTPRVDFIASYSKSNADTLNTYNQDSTSRSIGIQINVPLYAGGVVSSQSRQAAAALEKSKSDLQAKIDKTVLELRKDYAAVVSGAARIHALDQAVASAQMLIVATEQSIKGGVRINLDLLNAKQQLFTSQRDRTQARYNYLMSILKMKAAVGTLAATDLREIANYFK